MLSRNNVIAGTLGLLLGGGAVAIASGGAMSGGKAETERVVRDYLLANPEIIPEAMQRLQDRRMADVVQENRAAIETPFGSAWAGAEKGDVVLVGFFDYACGFCRRSNADIERLLREDGNLKVVWRELPVLGPDSQAAAEVSLAAARQGRFKQFYDALFAAGRPAPATLARVQKSLGIAASEAPEIDAEINKNYQLAQALNATGTPTFVVGDKVLQGAVGYEALKEAVADARKRG